MTAVATIVFLYSKFLEGAWVVVVAVPTFVFFFVRIHAYYERAGRDLGLGAVQVKPEAKRSLVIVPVTAVSRLTVHVISEALSLSEEVVAVTVVLDGGSDGDADAETLQQEWAYGIRAFRCVCCIRTTRPSSSRSARLSTRFARTMTNNRRPHPGRHPRPGRYRILHNQIDLVLSSALRSRPDVVVARVQLPLKTWHENRPLTSLPRLKWNHGGPDAPTG